jgi:hypothetical protein
MDHLLSHTLWKAAYRDALDKYADLPNLRQRTRRRQCTRPTAPCGLGLGTSAPKDLPAIMRST